jgi:hypothetical protein
MSEDLLEPPFAFEGTIVRTNIFDMWYVVIDGKEDHPAIYSPDPFLMDAFGWMRKRFIRGARVEGYASLPPHADTYWITGMVPVGMGGVTHAQSERSFSEKIGERVSYLFWLLNKKARQETLESVNSRWKKLHPTPEAAGA